MDDNSDHTDTSDFQDTENSTLAMEQESAKLQAEVQKLSKELEDLMSSRGLRGDPSKEEFGHFGAVDEEMEENSEGSFNPSEPLKSRIGPSDDDFLRFSDIRKGKEIPSPSFARSPGQGETAHHFQEPLKRKSPDRQRFTPTKRVINWSKVNEMLREEGFPVIEVEGNDSSAVPESVPDIVKTLVLTVKDLRRECREIGDKSSDFASEVDFYKKENEKLKAVLEDLKYQSDQQTRSLQGKVDSLSSKLKQKDQSISELKSSQRHTPEPRSLDSSRFSTLQDTIQAQKIQIEALEAQRRVQTEDYDRPKRPSSDLIEQIMELLDLKSERLIVSTLQKMLQVIRALPGLEHFIKSVRAEVLPSSSSAVDEVLPTIRTWKHKAKLWDEHGNLKVQICKLVGIDPAGTSSEVVTYMQLTALRAFTKPSDSLYFRKLFEVGPGEDLTQSITQVFLFVHEMKSLLQFCREALALNSNLSVQEQIDRIKMRLSSGD